MARFKYNAANSEHVMRLANNLATTPEDKYPVLLAALYGEGLMRVTGWRGLCIRLMVRWKGKGAWPVFFEQLQRRDRVLVRGMVVEAITHCLGGNGIDREDKYSVGGWSQREIDLLVGRVLFSNDEVA